MRRSYELHVTCIGLVAFLVAITSILFALGFTIMVLQTATRMVCQSVLTTSVNGTSASNICVT